MTDSTESAIRKEEAAACAQYLREHKDHSADPLLMGIAAVLDKCAASEPQPSHVNRPFWLVWGEHAGSPKKKHATESEAAAEAERLASMNQARFVVLKSVFEYGPSGVMRTDHATQ